MSISRAAKRSYDRKRYLANREKVCRRQRAASRAWWAALTPAQRSAIWRRSEYGIEPEEFDRLLRRQKNKCAICRASQPKDLDHCHRTGRIRGVLCRRCNVALGGFQDRISILQRAIKYLEQK